MVFLLVIFRNTATAPSTMPATYRHPDVAMHTIIRIVILPKTQKLLDDGSLLSSAARLGYVPGIFEHGKCVKVCTETEGKYEEDIVQLVRSKSHYTLFSRGSPGSLTNIPCMILDKNLAPTQNRDAAKMPAKYGCRREVISVVAGYIARPATYCMVYVLQVGGRCEQQLLTSPLQSKNKDESCWYRNENAKLTEKCEE